MISGIVELGGALMMRRVGGAWGWTAAFGVLSILAALFALMSPPATLAAIMSLIAIFAMLVGITLTVGAFRLRGIVHA
jgi:uncharacterized membrane protein HdeD (DUF308 family)